MTEEQKKRQLFNYKALATGLFLLMACIFIWSTISLKNSSAIWLGYIRAFSEAAMVGALADWFAVTALFHYPLGLKIPHTNLIENSKQRIGDNLGHFVVENFISPESIRPYINKLKVSQIAGQWLSKSNNQDLLIEQVSSIVKSAIGQLNDKEVVDFIAVKINEVGSNLKINEIAANVIPYLLDKHEQQAVITFIAEKVKTYVLENEDLIQQKVRSESYALIPKFIDNKLAEKITVGLAGFFDEVATEEEHPVRKEITDSAYQFAFELKNSDKWQNELNKIKESFLDSDRINEYAADIWDSLKQSLVNELDNNENSMLKKYVKENIQRLAYNLNNDLVLQDKIDKWVRYTAYRFVLKNSGKVSELISNTVGNWEGKELSKKLELEVGKDLQFIRINGTLVGGLVGLIIYTISHVL